MAWRRLVSGRKAKIATALLLTLQLTGCVADLASEQHSLLSVFCTAAPGDGLMELAGFLAWFVLAFSWIVGLTALRVDALRPLYWILVLLIPVGLVAQQALLDRHLLYCDAP